MADNFTTPVPDGTILATDQIATVHYPRSKVGFGVEGAYADVSATDPLPMTVVGTVPVSGTFWQATQPVSGTVSVSGAVAVTGTFYQATQPVSAASLPLPSGAATETSVAAINTKTPALGQAAMAASVPVALASNQTALAVTGTFWQATQPVSGTVAVSGSVAVTGTFWQATQPVSAASLPLPSGAATSANQSTEIAALATIGTRSYGTALTRVAVASTSAQSAAITGTEVLVHASVRCFIAAGSNPTATTSDIPLEIGEKFHLRITSGHKIAVLRDTADGFLNVVPVA